MAGRRVVLCVVVAAMAVVGLVWPGGDDNQAALGDDSNSVRRRLKCVYQNWNKKTVCDTGGNGPAKDGLLKLTGGGGGGGNKAQAPAARPPPPPPKPSGPIKRCPGGVTVPGHGPMHVINSHGSTASVDSSSNTVTVPVHSLGFLGDSCDSSARDYSNKVCSVIAVAVMVLDNSGGSATEKKQKHAC